MKCLTIALHQELKSFKKVFFSSNALEQNILYSFYQNSISNQFYEAPLCDFSVPCSPRRNRQQATRHAATRLLGLSWLARMDIKRATVTTMSIAEGEGTVRTAVCSWAACAVHKDTASEGAPPTSQILLICIYLGTTFWQMAPECPVLIKSTDYNNFQTDRMKVSCERLPFFFFLIHKKAPHGWAEGPHRVLRE